MLNILGIKLSNLGKDQVIKKLESFLFSEKQHYIVTPNPEIILAAQKDKELCDILNSSDMAPADGFGLKLAGLLKGIKVNRFSGSDLTPEVLLLAEKNKLKILIINYESGLSKSEDIENTLKKNYPNLVSLVVDMPRSINISVNLLSEINKFAPVVLFCTFGSPYQEKFVYNNLASIPSLKLALPIGGSFDFLTGKIKRAPLVMRQIGLEWLWRLAKQPKRIKRIFQAIFVFSYWVVIDYMKNKKNINKNININIDKNMSTNINENKSSDGKKVRLRFAPSPTGFLHVGNLRTALSGFLLAKSMKGDFILRIEDTDQKREVEGSVKSLIDILKWTGINFDEGPGIGGSFAPYTQTERLDIYKKYSDQLLAEGKAYRCFCSPERLDKMREDQKEAKLAPRYDRHCRDISTEESLTRANNGEAFVIRQKLPLDGEVEVYDEIRGKIIFNACDLDDHVLIKSNGVPTYQFANIVDDHLMEITHVTRGDEWLSSFPKNILLYQAFAWEAPIFIHLPLLLNKGGGKLGKRQGDVFVENYRQAGYLPEAIINFCALLGWHPKDDKEILSLEELKENFSISGLGSSPAVFDLEKLDYYNSYYIRQKSAKELISLSQEYLKEAGLPLSGDKLEKAVSLAKERLTKLSELPNNISFYFKRPEAEESLIVWKNISLEEAKRNLEEVFSFMLSLGSWEKEVLEKETIEWIKENKEGKNGDYLWPLRTALSGLKNSPSPFEVSWALGREESISRVEKVLGKKL